MIEIQEVTYSKNPVSTSEAFLFYVRLVEILAIWSDLGIKTWDGVQARTWEDLRRKIF